MIDSLNIFVTSSGGVIDVEPEQATDGVLQAKTGSLVYYVTIVNDVYAYFSPEQRMAESRPHPLNFQRLRRFLNKITAFAAAHGKKSFPDPNALAVEIKSSWVEAAGLRNLEQLHHHDRDYTDF